MNKARTMRLSRAKREAERQASRLRWRLNRDKYNAARRFKRKLKSTKVKQWSRNLFYSAMKQTWRYKFMASTTVADAPSMIFDKFETPCVLMQLDGPPILAWRRGDGTLREMPVDEIISLLKNAEVDR